MSTSRKNDSDEARANVAIIEPPPDCRRIVERTALLVSEKGLKMEKRIRACNDNNNKFNFLRSSDPYHAFYQHKLAEYRARTQDGAREDIIKPVAPPAAPESCVGRPVCKGPPFRAPPKLLIPHSFPIKAPEEITHEELATMKLTAQFVARYGMCVLAERLSMNAQIDSRCHYFTQLVAAYSRVIVPCQRGACTDLQLVMEEDRVSLHAFVGCADYFAHMEDEESCANVPPPPENITLRELATMKLTAQFVARYGMCFLADLAKRVSMKPELGFIKESDSRCVYFTRLVVAYSRVLTPCQRGVCTETLVEDFFDYLQMAMEMARADFHAVLGCVDYFAHMED